MKFVVTAGPTREYLDPVRFLSNPSTGKMGFAVARVAAMRGHEVALVAGPVSLKTPKGVRRIDVTSAREMLAAVEKELFNSSRDMALNFGGRVGDTPLPTGDSGGRVGDTPLPVGAALRADRTSQCSQVFVSTAAVADWRPAKCASRKLKKGQMSDTLKLVRNPDILKTVARPTKHQAPARIARASTIFVGFAAETNDVIAEARRKCREKNLDMIVANDVTEKGSGFGVDTNRVTLVRKDGSVDRLPLMTKLAVARRIVRECEDLCP
jgi:phosphopantothenoylcysteine decarboxylase/phosphopantothenate--cysteine ligase